MLVALSMPPVTAYYSSVSGPRKAATGRQWSQSHNAAIRLFSHAALPRSGCRVQSQTKTFTTLCLPGMMELLHLARWNIVKNEYFEDCQNIRIQNSSIHRCLLSSIDDLLNTQFNSVLICYIMHNAI